MTRRVLEASDRRVDEVRNLARLFRAILLTRGIGIPRFNALMNQWVAKNVPPNDANRSSIRGNFTKALMGDKMTWTTFVKGLEFLQASKVEFTVKCTWADGSVTTHSLSDEDWREEVERGEGELEDDPSPELDP